MSHVVGGACLGEEGVPDVGIALNDRGIAMRMVALVQTGPGVDQSLEEVAALGRQAVTDAIGKAREFRRELSELRIVGRKPSPNRYAEARIIPPLRMKARPRTYDLPGVLHRRRKRPDRGDEMRVGEVFEKKMPLVRVRIPDAFEAAGGKALRHH